MKPSGIGGQAVIEGVMMKNQSEYAIAVRKPNNEIVVKKDTFHSVSEKYTFLKLPILRGVLAFIESMVIGMKTLTFSASFFEEEEEVKPSKVESAIGKIFKGKAEDVIMGFTIFIAIVMAVGIFMVLPFYAAELFQKQIESTALLAVIEGVIRITIFIAYVVGISQMNDIKRVFMYHGAEHKTINCLENGLELTVSNVRGQSKHHKRCGTSFMLVVMFVSIIFFIFIRVETVWLRMVFRLLLVPIIAGVSYEFIKLAGRSESKVVSVLSKPGMWLQALTTKEPDDSMIAVAIQSVEAVFDWQSYLGSEKGSKKKGKKKSGKSAKVKDTQVEKVTLVEEKEVEVAEEISVTNSINPLMPDEEDDEILKALDKYFVFDEEKK
jgi:uncharacterized protein YqhQ